MKKFTCGHCGGRIAVNPRHLGTLVVCPECGKPTHPLAGDILAAAKGAPTARALSAEPVERRCENCGRSIGRLEPVQLWNNHLVCGDCQPRLARVAPDTGKPAAAPKALPAPAAGGGPSPSPAAPADAALTVSPPQPNGKLPVKRAPKPRKGRGKAAAGPALLPAPSAVPVAAEGGVTALPSPSAAQAGSNVPTLIFDRPAAAGAGALVPRGGGDVNPAGGRAAAPDPLATAGAAAMTAVAAVSAVAPIAVKVARVWSWRRPPAAPPARAPEGQLRNRLIGLSVLAIVGGAALYGALTLLLAVAGFITKLAIGLLAFGGIVVGLWVAVVALKRYVPWPPFGRKSSAAGGTVPAGGDAVAPRQ